MTVKERLHELIEILPESELSALLERLPPDAKDKRHRIKNPSDLLKILGPWEDERATEEIIAEIYQSRTPSRTEVKL